MKKHFKKLGVLLDISAQNLWPAETSVYLYLWGKKMHENTFESVMHLKPPAASFHFLRLCCGWQAMRAPATFGAWHLAKVLNGWSIFTWLQTEQTASHLFQIVSDQHQPRKDFTKQMLIRKQRYGFFQLLFKVRFMCNFLDVLSIVRFSCSCLLKPNLMFFFNI